MNAASPPVAKESSSYPVTSPAKSCWASCFGVGWANAVSLGRMALALWVVLGLASQNSSDFLLFFVATIVIIWLDGVDGYLARKLGESSASGAVIDILSDRCVELFYWIVFAVLGWVPLWMALLVVLRGIWVDGLRSLALKEGYTAFGSTTLMQHPISILLVSSRFSRWTYAACKAVGFSLIILAHTPEPMLPAFLQGMHTFASIAAVPLLVLTFIFCWLRGLPVLLEARRFL